jgi:hypothetical protein
MISLVIVAYPFLSTHLTLNDPLSGGLDIWTSVGCSIVTVAVERSLANVIEFVETPSISLVSVIKYTYFVARA